MNLYNEFFCITICHRAIENRCDTSAVTGVEINDRERKWIEGIMQQLSSPRHRQKSICTSTK